MKKGWLIALVVVATLALAQVLLIVGIRWTRIRSQDRWQRTAIPAVAALEADTNWVASQISALQSEPLEEDGSRSGWMTDDIIFFKNREWIVYASACTKENWRLQDMFIGKASDGKWYYTTFHFCTQMKVLPVMTGRPTDLESFKTKYFLREFGGSCDDKLEKTWPHAEE